MALRKKENSPPADDKLRTALVPDDEQPYSIPENWVWTRLGSITAVVGGGTPRSYDSSFYENGDIPWIRPVDLSDYDEMYISYGSRSITREGLKNSSARLIPKNSLLFSSRAPIGYVAIAANDVTTSQGFKSFLPTSALVPQFGYWYLKYAKPLAESLASGTTFQEISGSKAALIPIPLPPLPQQQSIAVKLESLLGKIKEAKALLDEIPEILQNFRQTVLAAACSGRLTEDWRKTNTDIEKASVSLRRTQEERLKLYQEECLIAKNEKKRKPNEPEILKILAASDFDDSLKNLPKGWTSTVFINLCVLQRGFDLPIQNRLNGKYPIVSSAGIIDYHFEYKVPGPGVVIGRSGSIGKAFFVEDNYWPLNTSLYVKDFNGNDPKFLFYFLNNFNFLPYSASTAVPTLNRNNLFAERVFIPPTLEQNEIVRRVESLFAKADELEVQYKEAMELIESLPEIILSKAFRGELVPQDPDDESALILLEGISQTKAYEDDQIKVKDKQKGKAMKEKKNNQRDVPTILRKAGMAMTPEEIFAEGSFDEESVDIFYQQLRDAVNSKKVKEIRKGNIVRLEVIKE